MGVAAWLRTALRNGNFVYVGSRDRERQSAVRDHRFSFQSGYTSTSVKTGCARKTYSFWRDVNFSCCNKKTEEVMRKSF